MKKNLLLCVILFAFSLGNLFAQTTEPTAQLDINIYETSERYDQAMELFSQGKDAQALEILDELAQKGDYQSKYAAGLFYFLGFAGKRDYKKVWEYLSESADCGEADSIYVLNLCLMYGLGCEKDPVTAMNVLNEMPGIQTYFPEISYVIGEILTHGEGCEVNYEEAYQYLQIAADNEVADAFYHLGNYSYFGYVGEPNTLEALNYYMKGSMLGSGWCSVQMGSFYANGIGVEQDYEMAYRCFELGANHGIQEGMNKAAYCLANGIGCEFSSENADKALIYWGMLEVQNYAPGIYQFGLQYVRDKPYFKHDKKRAVQLFKKAMELGEEDATDYYYFYSQDNSLIIQYFDECQQYNDEIIWLREMAEQGDEQAAQKVEKIEKLIESSPSRVVSRKNLTEIIP